MGQVLVGEGTDDDEQGLVGGDGAEELAAEALGARDVEVGAAREPGHVDVLHVGGRDLARVEHVGQHAQPGVGHFDDGHVGLVGRHAIGGRFGLRVG